MLRGWKQSGKRQWHKRAVNIHYTHSTKADPYPCSYRPSAAWSLCTTAEEAEVHSSVLLMDKYVQLWTEPTHANNLSYIALQMENTSVLLLVEFYVVAHKSGEAYIFVDPQWPPYYLLFFCQVLLHFETEHQFKQKSHNCRGNRATEGAQSGESTSSHADSCENKTEAVKCWWDCQTKVEQWHIYREGVRATGHAGYWKRWYCMLRGFWHPHIKCRHFGPIRTSVTQSK